MATRRSPDDPRDDCDDLAREIVGGEARPWPYAPPDPGVHSQARLLFARLYGSRPVAVRFPRHDARQREVAEPLSATAPGISPKWEGLRDFVSHRGAHWRIATPDATRRYIGIRCDRMTRENQCALLLHHIATGAIPEPVAILWSGRRSLQCVFRARGRKPEEYAREAEELATLLFAYVAPHLRVPGVDRADGEASALLYLEGAAAALRRLDKPQAAPAAVLPHRAPGLDLLKL